MPCVEVAEGVVVCRPSYEVRRRIRHCPTCGCRRRFAVQFFEWYDPIVTCCHCGDAWEGGYRMPRPFKRGWRESAARHARDLWASVIRTGDTA